MILKRTELVSPLRICRSGSEVSDIKRKNSAAQRRVLREGVSPCVGHGGVGREKGAAV